MTETLPERRAVIIGGGIVGTAAFISLVRHAAAREIHVVDPGPIGLGRAFATAESKLLTNTSVDTMSIIPDARDDFLLYLRNRGLSVDRGSCVPRYFVSQYVRDRFEDYKRLADAKGIAWRHVRGAATLIQKTGDHLYEVKTNRGDVVAGESVLVCCGFGRPFIPDVLRGHEGDETFLASPYPEQRLLERVKKRRSHVLIMGTRLSAIDAALLLCADGHSAVMASRTGQLPAVRTKLVRPQTPRIREATIRALDLDAPKLYRSIFRIVAGAAGSPANGRLSQQTSRASDIVERLRQETALAASGKNRWEDVILDLLEAAHRVLLTREPSVQDRAIARCWKYVQRYLFSFPVINAETLLAHVDRGRLAIRASVPIKVERTACGWMTFWPGDQQPEIFDAIVCATGFDRPKFHASETSLRIVSDAHRSCDEPTVFPDLRVALTPGGSPENIWLVGVSSYLRSPLVSIVYQGAEQADAIARGLAVDPPSQSEPQRRLSYAGT